MTKTAKDTRVAAIQGYYAEGKRAETLPDDVAPWVRDGLSAMQKGKPVTRELLERADRDQTMVIAGERAR